MCFLHERQVQDGDVKTSNRRDSGKESITVSRKIEAIRLCCSKTGKPRHQNLGDAFKIEKTEAANVLENTKKIHQQHEQFHEKNKKRILAGKYKPVSDVLFGWYKKCFHSSLSPNYPLPKKEAVEIKKATSRQCI